MLERTRCCGWIAFIAVAFFIWTSSVSAQDEPPEPVRADPMATAQTADEPPEPVRADPMAVAQVADEPPEPDRSKVNDAPWVRQLGDLQFKVRQHAKESLMARGSDAKDALLAGLQSEDPQVRRSCRRILADVLESDYERRLQAFIANKDPQADHQLPGWDRFRQLVGDSPVERELFIDMQREERGLLASAEAGPGAAADALRLRFRQIYQLMNQRNSGARRIPAVGSIAGLLFTASDESLKLPPELIGHSYWSSLVQQQTFQKPLLEGERRESLRKLLGAWLVADSGLALLQQKLMLAVQHQLPQGLVLALAAVENKAVHANYRAYAITAVGSLGGKEYAHMLIRLLEDKSECVRRAIRVNGKQQIMAIELRDVALAWLIHLTKQDLASYGLKNAKAAFDRFDKNPRSSVSVSSLGFESTDARDAGFKKWNEWLAEHPFPEQTEDVAKVLAQAKKTKFTARMNAAAFQPNIFFAQAKQAPPDEDQLNRADRQFVRLLKIAKNLMAQGQHSEAASLLGDILSSEDDYIFQPDRDVPLIRGFKAEAERLLGSMPQSGRDAYQRLYGPQATRSLQAAIAGGDYRDLTQVAQQYFYTRPGAEAAYLLGCHFLDRGHPLRAALYFQRIDDRRDQRDRFEPALSLRMAACWAMAGMPKQAEEVLVTLRSSGKLRNVEIGGEEQDAFSQDEEALAWLEKYIGPQQRFEQGFGWLTRRGAANRNAGSDDSGPYLSSNQIASTIDDEIVTPLIVKLEQELLNQRQSRLPSCSPIVVGDVVVLRLGDRTIALNFETDELLWEVDHDDALRHITDHASKKRKEEKNDYLKVGIERRLWDNATYGGVSSDGTRVYCVEDLSFGADDYHRLVVTPDGRQQLDTGVQKSHNTLVAYDAKTGKLLWEVGGADGVKAAKLTGVFFLGAPLAMGGRLYVMGLSGAETRLYELDPANGDSVSVVPLHHRESQIPTHMAPHLPPWVFENPSRRSGAAPSAAEGVLVCPISGNDFAAVDLTAQQVLWMYRSEQDDEGFGSRFGAQWQQKLFELSQHRHDQEWADCLPCIADGRVILTPTKAGELYCLNLRDGSLEWSSPRRDGFYVAGVREGKVLVVGRSSVWALHLNDGSLAWESEQTMLPAGAVPTGRGYVGGDRYYLPLSTAEVAAVEFETGAMSARSLSENNTVPGNLVAVRGAVYSQTARGVEKYETLAARSERMAPALAADSLAPQMLVQQGEILLFQGRIREAVEVLQQAMQSPLADAPTKQSAKEMLQDAVIEGVRTDFKNFVGFVDTTLDLGQPDDDLRLLSELADAYARGGRPEAALDLYLRLAASDKLDAMRFISAGRQVRADRELLAKVERLLAQSEGETLVALNSRIVAAAENGFSPQELAVLDRRDSTYATRLQQASKLASEKKWLESHHWVQVVLQRGSATEQRGAVALLAENYRSMNRPKAAARCYRHLLQQPNQPCLDGKTASDLVDALPADDPVRTHLADGASLQFPVENPAKKTEKKSFSVTYHYPVTTTAYDPRFDEELNLEIDTQGRTLTCQNSAGRALWTCSLTAANSNWRYSSAIFSHARAVVMGRLVLLWSGDRMFGIDSQTGKVIWKQDTITSKAPYPNMYRQPPMWLAMVRNGHVTVGNQVCPVAVSADAVVFQRERDLTAVDPNTGKILWNRDGAPQYCDLFAHEGRLFCTSYDGEETIIYSMLDGAEIGRRTLPKREHRLATHHGRVVYWKADAAGSELSLLDAWSGQVVWKKAFSPSAQPWSINTNETAVLESDGTLYAIANSSGASLMECQLPEQKGLRNFMVWRGEDRYLLTTNAADKPAAPAQGNVFGMQIIMGSAPVNGLVAAIDHQGKLIWSTEVFNQTIKRHQPSEFPVVAFLTQMQVRQGRAIRSRWRLTCLDKRTGKALHDETTDGSNNTYQTWLQDGPIAFVKTRVQQVQFNFAEEAKAEEAKKDEAKKDEAKKDEAKKDEAKKEEAKKDEAKKEAVQLQRVQLQRVKP